MKTDFSRILYDRYFNLTNRNIEVKLKNGNIIRGIIVGFFKGYEDNNEPYIMQWHIADEKNKILFGIDAFGNMDGTIINSKDITEVKFLEDNSIIRFNNN